MASLSARSAGVVRVRVGEDYSRDVVGVLADVGEASDDPSRRALEPAVDERDRSVGIGEGEGVDEVAESGDANNSGGEQDGRVPHGVSLRGRRVGPWTYIIP